MRSLPKEVQTLARKAYRLWISNPSHPGLQFKRVHQTEPIFSARVGLGWRSVGVKRGGAMIWFWIGSHADYDELLKRLRKS